MDTRKDVKQANETISPSDSDKAAAMLSRKRPISTSLKSTEQHLSPDSNKLNTDEYWSKKPRLIVDTSRECQPLCEALSSNESFSSGHIDNDNVNSRQDSCEGAWPPVPASGLSAYLEDIDSDEELDEIEPSVKEEETSKPHGKDDLLSMMDKVDREIASIEQRISSLEAKQKELNETDKVMLISSETNEPPVVMATPGFEEIITNHEKSVIEEIYSENKLKARNTHVPLSHTESHSLASHYPLYYQPSETPLYWKNIRKYRQFRPELLKYLKNRKLSLFKKECSLCEEYDNLHAEWERKTEKWERSQKKRGKDLKNKDLFEKMFPELRSKSEQLRDQAERFNCSGVRGFGFVKSEAELDELAYELMEQEEAKGRHQLTHAVLPPMILDPQDRRVQFIDTNGLLKDPMVLYRDSKSLSLWTDNEKAIFRDKFQVFPKNFEKISTFLPDKTVSDCVRYYYLAKKNGNFKSLLRRSTTFKRRRHLKSTADYSLSSPLLMDQTKNKPPPPQTPTQAVIPVLSPPRKDSVEWSKEDIEKLKQGLRLYGRAWGRVYKEVGGFKTATQCKQFYDDYCTDAELDLNSALAEHSARKNAERVEKKMAEIKRGVSMSVESLIHSDGGKTEEEDDDDDSASDTTEETLLSQTEEDEDDQEEEEDDEEDESDSETTITDSGQEDHDDSTPTGVPKLRPLQLSSTTHDTEPIQSPLDIFLSAAEALSNTVPSEVALHDHTYSCPPLDIQGSSGLQLIAAAAAVVSPGLSRNSNTWNSKQSPLSSHHSAMKAPRGRPPNTQKRSSSTSQRIGPSYLTPTTGSSQNVLLQDLKPTLRGRSRSAPTEKPRPTSTIPQKQHPPTIASPLLLKSGAKIYTGPPPAAQQTVHRGVSGSSPLTYSSRSKDQGIHVAAGSSLVSLKPSSSTVDTVVSSNSGTTTMADLKTVTTGVNVPSRPATVTSTSTRSKESTTSGVFELNLGNMALLLAAGNPQQATLLLPPSSLFNKHTLAVLHSGSLTDTNGGGTLSVNTASTLKATPTISIDLSKTSVDNSSIPIVAPIKGGQSGKQTLTLSLTPSATKLKPSTTSPAIIYAPKQPPTVNRSISSSPAVIPAATPLTVTPTPSIAIPVSAPTTDDLSNLNLLSNLVAGMSKKPQKQQVPNSMTPAMVTKPPVSTMANKPLNTKPSSHPTPSTATTVSTSNSNNLWKKGVQQQSDSVHPLSLSNTSSQQSLMLYTRSLPLKSSNKGPIEDEDHLEYATRGIDELTRLLGGGAGDSNGLSDHSSSKHSQWSPDELLCNPFTTAVSDNSCLSSSLITVTASSTGGGFHQPPNTNVPAGLATHSST